MGREKILRAARKKSGCKGPRLEKVWEILMHYIILSADLFLIFLQ